MKRFNFFRYGAGAFLIIFAMFAGTQQLSAQKTSELKYYDVKELGLPILGKGFEKSGNYYSRLPEEIKGKVRKEVWDLGQNCAGIAVRFNSNSSAIAIRWDLLNGFVMHHMTGVGIRGLDLYTLENGKWLYVGVAQPYKVDGGESSKNCRAMVRKKIAKPKDSKGNVIGNGSREYLLYLPLYDGVVNLSIGVDSTASISRPKSLEMVPERYLAKESENYASLTGKALGKPVVFYGTSVTQGGCATRPGMAYTNIISRDKQKEVINLGFSGNGRMDKIMAEKIAEIDAEAFFIDCLANCTAKIIEDSTEYFVRTIAKANPQKPIYLISNYCYPYQYLDEEFMEDLSKENKIWYSFYLKFKKEGMNIHYINLTGSPIKVGDSKSKACGRIETSPIGPDHESTVDGVHLTDIGFQRMARILGQYVK